jgi:hypothetical protein
MPPRRQQCSGQEVHRVRDLERLVREAAVEVAELVAEVGDDVIAERLDVLARERLVLRRRARRRARAEPWSRVVLQVEGGVDQVVALVGEVRQRAVVLQDVATGEEEDGTQAATEAGSRDVWC